MFTLLGRQPAVQSAQVGRWVADEAVRPVDDHPGAPVGSPVAGMEIAVHQGDRQAGLAPQRFRGARRRVREEPAFNQVFGMSIYEYLQTNPAAAQIFGSTVASFHGTR
nr:hypothetical protein [Kribbella albertanoniae]